jgi:hypothetical protein
MVLMDNAIKENTLPIKWSLKEYMLRPCAHCKDGC